MHSIILAHRILVSLFLLQYMVKLILLLTNKKDELAKYTKATRIAEMLVSVGFLVTGVWVLVQMGDSGLSKFMIIKLVCVFAAIPLAIIGFKRANKALAVLSVVLILAAYGLAEMNVKAMAGGKVDTSSTKDPLEMGKIVYQNKSCIGCHGPDGKLGANGAKDLSATTLSIDEQKAIIKNGKSPMPGYNDLNDEQLQAVIEYIGTFKK
jgi:mono/diheme cytochrome c family protein